jgi:hypothetical protein
LRHYAFALLISCLAPWLAAFFGSWWFSTPYFIPWKLRPDIFLWMLVPAGITFLALLPFLRYQVGRKAALIILCVVWVVLEKPAKTKGHNSPNEAASGNGAIAISLHVERLDRAVPEQIR